MECSTCHTTNRAERRFCLSCGARLGDACRRCGFLNEGVASFCGGCGDRCSDDAKLTSMASMTPLTPSFPTPPPPMPAIVTPVMLPRTNSQERIAAGVLAQMKVARPAAPKPPDDNQKLTQDEIEGLFR